MYAEFPGIAQIGFAFPHLVATGGSPEVFLRGVLAQRPVEFPINLSRQPGDASDTAHTFAAADNKGLGEEVLAPNERNERNERKSRQTPRIFQELRT